MWDRARLQYEKEHQRDAETYTSRTQQSYRYGRYGGLSTADCKNLQLQSINLLSRHQQTGQAQDRPRSGRPRVTTSAEDRCIQTIHLRNRFVTETALGHPISRLTILRRLRRDGIKAFRPFRGMALTLLHCQRRLKWARTARRWQRRD